jgi:hypothetical protein
MAFCHNVTTIDPAFVQLFVEDVDDFTQACSGEGFGHVGQRGDGRTRVKKREVTLQSKKIELPRFSALETAGAAKGKGRKGGGRGALLLKLLVDLRHDFSGS